MVKAKESACCGAEVKNNPTYEKNYYLKPNEYSHNFGTKLVDGRIIPTLMKEPEADIYKNSLFVCSKCGKPCELKEIEPKEVLWICPKANDCLKLRCEHRNRHKFISRKPGCSYRFNGNGTINYEHNYLDISCPSKCIPYQPEASKETTKPEPTGYDEKAHEKKIDKCYDCHYLISDTGRCEHCKGNDLFVQKEPKVDVKKKIGEILEKLLEKVHPENCDCDYHKDKAVAKIVALMKREGR